MSPEHLKVLPCKRRVSEFVYSLSAFRRKVYFLFAYNGVEITFPEIYTCSSSPICLSS